MASAAAKKNEMHEDFTAESEISVEAPPEAVWAVITDNKKFGEVMFGSTVTTDWKVGSPIVYSGEWEGKPFEDKGKILELEKNKLFRSTHIAGTDKTHTEHEVAYHLAPEGSGTKVKVTQTNNATQDAADHSTKNWEMMLKNLKKVVEA